LRVQGRLRVDLANLMEHVLLSQTGRSGGGTGRACVCIHVDDQAQELLRNPLNQPNSRRLKNVRFAVTRAQPDEAAGLRAIGELATAHLVSPWISCWVTWRAWLEAIAPAPQKRQPSVPEGTVVESLAEDDGLAHRRSSSISLREKATSGPLKRDE